MIISDKSCLIKGLWIFKCENVPDDPSPRPAADCARGSR